MGSAGGTGGCDGLTSLVVAADQESEAEDGDRAVHDLRACPGDEGGTAQTLERIPKRVQGDREQKGAERRSGQSSTTVPSSFALERPGDQRGPRRMPRWRENTANQQHELG